ncbi:MAG: hypothetical protein SGI97_06860 [candidate division Zixibacteria bacterium]|nr:hypothetical protein [candidate division Zixibacteria bacterium]
MRKSTISTLTVVGILLLAVIGFGQMERQGDKTTTDTTMRHTPKTSTPEHSTQGMQSGNNVQWTDKMDKQTRALRTHFDKIHEHVDLMIDIDDKAKLQREMTKHRQMLADYRVELTQYQQVLMAPGMDGTTGQTSGSNPGLNSGTSGGMGASTGTGSGKKSGSGTTGSMGSESPTSGTPGQSGRQSDTMTSRSGQPRTSGNGIGDATSSGSGTGTSGRAGVSGSAGMKGQTYATQELVTDFQSISEDFSLLEDNFNRIPPTGEVDQVRRQLEQHNEEVHQLESKIDQHIEQCNERVSQMKSDTKKTGTTPKTNKSGVRQGTSGSGSGGGY